MLNNKILLVIKTWSDMIKVEHTIFSAPFMLSSLFIASSPFMPKLMVFIYCIIALIGARCFAMSVNRIIDHKIDKLNPRTANRAIPAGKLSLKQVYIFAFISLILLSISALNLPKICLYLLPFAVFWLSFYSFTKRFTYLCHFVLGISLGGASLGASLAVKGAFDIHPILFACGITCWVAGFDILYSIQDLNFDRQYNLHSIPAKFGLSKSLLISKIVHTLSVLFFCLAYFFLPVDFNGTGYIIGLIILCLGLLIEHYIVHKSLNNIEIAFFTANAIIAGIFFICIFISSLLKFI